LPFCRKWTLDNQSAFWSLHRYAYGKTFPAIPFSRATATVATERKNGNGTTERHDGTTERQNGTAKRQRQNGNGMVETRHNTVVSYGSKAYVKTNY